ncbi:MAG: hypothetical protein PHQ13_03445 [Rhodoferax sp.]|nr:hypothetical protein [Rhodoferax sp.]
MSLTKGQWEAIKHTLSFPWGVVKLDVDGYKVNLHVKQVKPLKFEIFPYVNGEFKGAWLRGDCEESKRFMRPVQLSVFKPAEKRNLLKGLSKKAVKDYLPDIDKKFTVYQWGWASFDALRRHLIANNTVIELTKDEAQGGYESPPSSLP